MADDPNTIGVATRNPLEEEFFAVEGNPPDWADLAERVDVIRTLLAQALIWLRSESSQETAGPALDAAFRGMLELHLKRSKG